jgi:outer membrane lipoprotein-sorting protein
MEKRIHRTAVIVLTIALISLSLGLSQGIAADLASIIQEAKVKYVPFEKTVKDMTILGETKMVTPQGEMFSTIKIFKKGEKFRTETIMSIPQIAEAPEGMEEIVTTIIYDGKDYWMISPFMGKKKLSSAEEKQYQTERNWWEWVSEKAELAGEDKIDGRVCYIIRIKEENATATRMWLDKTSLILVKMEAQWEKGKTVLILFSNFRKIKGDWEMAYKTDVSEGGKLLSSTLIKTVDINKGLSDDLFNPDKVG